MIILLIGVGLSITSCKAGKVDNTAVSANGEYILTYEWPQKPKMGAYTLKANLVDKTGNPVEGVDIIVNYDMPTCGSHAKTETMKRNDKGDYLLPINFVMRGEWEIVLSAQKDEQEIVVKKITVGI
jgi:nitrogen fixation protein FixH